MVDPQVSSLSASDEGQDEFSGFEIALIGMAGRFPGASNVEEFWQNLRNGVESIAFFSKEELAGRVDPALLEDPDYVRAFGALDGIEEFDAAFFGYPPREAAIMDPQQRVFLECAWQALENAGYASGRAAAPIGVYAGLTMNSYLENNLLGSPELRDLGNGLLTKIGNDKDFLATRVSYKLNLGGPALTIQTACSTSLVAVHVACQALLSGDCEMALAGGVSISVPQAGYLYTKGGIVSSDGHCRPFDARAEGTVGGNAVGIVVLKRLADALDDGDDIRAVIKGSAINNDGSDKVGYTAPSLEGQASVIRRAHSLAGVEPQSIDYVEAHGTATALGDPIEVAALKQAFRIGASCRASVGLGSVKSNIGHTDAAAGVASLIKVTMAMQHGELPPSLNFETPNPKLELEDSPFYVNARLSPWPSPNGRRRAGVSSFGIGGTNAHIVLEEAPARRLEPSTRPWHLLMWSARTATALDTASQNLAHHLDEHPEVELADVAHTLQTGRHEFKHRRMAVWGDTGEARKALLDRSFATVASGEAEPGDRPVLFMFPGQGAQHPNMARDLYRHERVFREHVDRCCELLREPLGLDLREILFPNPNASEFESSAALLRETRLTQPALFTIEYSLAKLWIEWGIRPRAMIGHSVGEYVAACLAEVFSLEQGLLLVATRGRLMQELPAGSMLAVARPAAEVAEWLDGELDLAGVNEPSGCVVSGCVGAIERLQENLEQRGVSFQHLLTSHAFHSQMMDAMVAPFTAEVAKLDLAPPRIPFLSNLTGRWITAGEATDPAYWARHLREPVQFSGGIELALEESERIFLEVGPGTTLSTLARRQLKRASRPRVFASLPHARVAGEGGSSSDAACMLRTLGQLWLAGISIRHAPLYADERRRRIPLPSYPFERSRYWVEAQAGQADEVFRSRSGVEAGDETIRHADVSDWFYLPTWRGTPSAPGIGQGETSESLRSWLVLLDRMGIGQRVADGLRERGHTVCTVSRGTQFAKRARYDYSMVPGERGHYAELLDALQGDGCFPDVIVHAWAISSGSDSGEAYAESTQVFHSLIQLAQALGSRDLRNPVEIVALSNGIHQIAGEGALAPEKATLLGPCRVIPKEYPQLSCRSIDVDLPQPGSTAEGALVEQLQEELVSPAADALVAYRGDHRFTQSFERTQLHKPSTSGPRLRKHGVYLITGGLGGIGFALAEHFAHNAQAKLVLLGRSSFPQRENFGSWLSDHEPADRVCQAIRRIESLEAAGAEVRVKSADVSDGVSMRRVVDEVRQEFGGLNGVVHAAGLPDGRLIQRRSDEDLDEILASKVAGTRVLDELLSDEPLDFFVLCSSLSSTLAPAGQVAYVAANAFLDAFASSRGRSSGGQTVSIGWDTWSEVGMAVLASEQLARPPASRRLPDAVEAMPPFDRRIDVRTSSSFGGGIGASSEVIFSCDLRVDRQWVLGEHRIGGKALLPAAGFVEFVAAAVAQYTGAEGVDIAELVFLQPLQVGPEEERELRTVLTERDGRFEVEIRSRATSTEGPWLQHVRGELTAIPNPRCRTLDLDSLKARAAGWRDATRDPRRPHIVEVSDRWESRSHELVEEREGLANFELASRFDGDLAAHPVHPALLDAASSFLVRHFRGDHSYLPYACKGLRISRPLTNSVVSHMRCLQSAGGSSDTLSFSVTLMDSEGNELISIDEYILRKVAVDVFVRPEKPKASNELLRDGMSTDDALDVFDRILASGQTRVLVSTLDLDTRQARGDALRAEGFVPSPDENLDEATRYPRPSLSSVYLAARSETEGLLIEIWQSLLGIHPVGVDDDFLELGGDSLLATQVTARIRNELEIELPIGALFDSPTVAGLARRADSLKQSASGEDQEMKEASGGSDETVVEREEFEF